ncbi:MAG TPA: gliding motility-associated C-terminal domain-containing protein, partial [Chitinophagales bacterium]|nr:gliding motility-associated C-terminal domain-containing protein [Chitinophagales bacterium]
SSIQINTSASICAGDSFFAGGDWQSVPGVYTDTFVSASGCDSIVQTTLIILQGSVTNISPTICEGETYFAGGALQTTAGVYFDTIPLPGGCDSIVITTLTVNDTAVTNLSFDICNGDSIFAEGSWRKNPGTYFDNLTTTSGCDSTVITSLTVRPQAIYNYVKRICEGDSALIEGTWYVSPVTIFDTLEGAAANGCDSIVVHELIVVSGNAFNLQVDPPSPTTIDSGQSVQLHVYANTPQPAFQWNPSNTLSCDNCWNPIATPVRDQTYSVTVTDSSACSQDSADVEIRVRLFEPDNPDDCFHSIYVPNAFTPNGDGVNDIFYVYGNGIDSLYFIVANRWGEVMFESHDVNAGWDGYYRGELQMPGVYVYYIKVLFCDGTRLKYSHPYRKGSVTLIR